MAIRRAIAALAWAASGGIACAPALAKPVPLATSWVASGAVPEPDTGPIGVLLRDADLTACASRLDAPSCERADSFFHHHCRSDPAWIPASDADCQEIEIALDAERCRFARYYDLVYCDALEQFVDGRILLWTPIMPGMRVRLEGILRDSIPWRDEHAWASSGIELCLAPELSMDCDGVAEYLVRFPEGAHAADAAGMLAATALARKKLAQEETKKKVDWSACIDDCTRRCWAKGGEPLPCAQRCRARCDRATGAETAAAKAP